MAAQETCKSPDPTPEEYAQMIADRAEIYEDVARSTTAPAVIHVPVSYHFIRTSTGDWVGHPPSNAYADQGIASLNQAYAGANLQFYRLGDFNLLDFSPLFNEPTWISETYSYVKTALNVYVGDARANYTNQPTTTNIFPPYERGTSYVGELSNFGPTNPYSIHAHEVGHYLGLLHTHGAGQTYNYPVLPNQIDHPNNGPYKREMVVRPGGSTTGTFLPNCDLAGDLCCDTEADCTINRNHFPEFNAAGVHCGIPNTCTPGCVTGTYRDYNGDAISGTGIWANLMSDHYGGNTLSLQQLQSARGNYEKYWLAQNTEPHGFVQDRVEFMDGSMPLKQVVIQWRHPSILTKYSNSLSTVEGGFQGVLYNNAVTAKVWKLGSGKKVNNSPLPGQTYLTDEYTKEDWLEGVKACDITRIVRHIQGLDPMNRWQIIAADVNRSNSVTTFDIVEIRKLILGIYKKFPAVDAPWRFIPEYIPADYLLEFNLNPFLMHINNVLVTGAPYTDPTWEYQITNGNNGKSGYDGVHLGDVDDCTRFCEDPPVFSLVPTVLAPGQLYDVKVQASHFKDVAAFQLGMFVDYTKLDVLDVLPGILPDFTSDAVGAAQLTDSQLKFLWFKNSGSSHTIIDGSELFTIRVQAKQIITDINAAIHLDDAVLKNAMYKESDCEHPVALSGSGQLFDEGSEDSRTTGSAHTQQMRLVCYPNPVSGQLTVAFEQTLAESGDLTLTDVHGHIAYTTRLDLSAGVNTILIPAGELQNTPAGLLSVTLRTASNIRTERVIKL